jgi:hypothetical protein
VIGQWLLGDSDAIDLRVEVLNLVSGFGDTKSSKE